MAQQSADGARSVAQEPLSLLTEGAVTHLDDRLGPLSEATTTPADPPEAPVRLLVIDAYRYRIDQSWRHATKQAELAPEHADADVFDIVVTDGTHKAKMVLDMRHNALLRRGGIVDFVIQVKRSDVDVCFDEVRVPVRRFLVLRDFTVLPDRVAVDPTQLLTRSDMEKTLFFQPLAGSRIYYLSMWNDDDPLMEDPQWIANKISLLYPNDIPLPGPILPLADAIERAANHPQSVPPLVGRVKLRHMLSHYGKPNDVKEGFPFRFSFEIFDDTTTVPIVAWNRMSSRLFTALGMNQLVLIENYKLRKQYNATTGGGIEVSVNTRKPEGRIRLLRDVDMAPVPQWRARYPERERVYESALSVTQLPDGSVFDLIGRVIMCGRIERERTTKGSFSQFVWVALKDHSTPQPLFVKLYTCSQPWDFFSVVPGTVLRLQNVKLLSITVDSVTPRRIFCVSTYTTFINAFNSRPNEFSAVIRGKSTQHVPRETDTLRAIYCSGIYVGLPPPYTDADMMRRFVETEAVAFGVMLDAVRDLEFLERRAFVIQGRVNAIDFGSAFRRAEGEPPATETFAVARKAPVINAVTSHIHPDPAVVPVTVMISDVANEKSIVTVLPLAFYEMEDMMVSGVRQVFPTCCGPQQGEIAYADLARNFHEELDKKPLTLMLLDAIRVSPTSVQMVLLKAIPLV